MTQPIAMTITEFCRQFRISRPTFYAWAQVGDAPVVRAVGGKRLILAEDVDKWRQDTLKPVYYGTSCP